MTFPKYNFRELRHATGSEDRGRGIGLDILIRGKASESRGVFTDSANHPRNGATRVGLSREIRNGCNRSSRKKNIRQFEDQTNGYNLRKIINFKGIFLSRQIGRSVGRADRTCGVELETFHQLLLPCASRSARDSNLMIQICPVINLPLAPSR